MRDTNGLYSFYNKLMEVHMTHFPDLRFGQLIVNIQEYHSRNHDGADIFYLEEDEMIKLLEDYAHHTVSEYDASMMEGEVNMSTYRHKKAVRLQIDEEVAYEVFSVNDRRGVIEYLEKTQFEVAPTKQFFIDFNLPCNSEADREWGKTRPLTNNEYKKYSALFHDLINGEYPILPCMLRVVEYCWYDCDDAPDYFDETTIHDDFYNEVL